MNGEIKGSNGVVY